MVTNERTNQSINQSIKHKLMKVDEWQTFTGAGIRYEFMTLRTLTDKAADSVYAVTTTT